MFTPSSEDEGKKVVALIEMGENAIAKLVKPLIFHFGKNSRCYEAKHPISRLEEPYLSECQLKWCRENGKPGEKMEKKIPEKLPKCYQT